jgi:predicted anti-sigma-YlaC factor YlaD
MQAEGEGGRGVAAPAGLASCEEARRLLVKFLEGALPRYEDRTLRRHLPYCDECRTIYRETLASAGSLGRQLREVRVAEEKRARRATQRRLAFGATGGARGRLLALRPLLWTALIVVLFLNFSRSSAPPVVAVTWQAGEVLLPAGRIGATRPDGELKRGDWCITRADSRVELTSGATHVLVGSSSQVLVEEADPLRLRLQSGSVSATGACTITTQLGVIGLEDGAVQIERDETKLEVRCLLGTASVTTPERQGRIRAGESEIFRLPL